MATLLLALTAGASAHDTWFTPRGQRVQGDLFMALGTGNQFPTFDSPVGPEHLQISRCREGGKDVALNTVAQASTSLILKARTQGRAALSCWVQLHPSEIELAPRLVAVYLQEAQPPPAVLEAWAALQARGLPWKERYTKHARIVFPGDGAQPMDARQAQPEDMGMDMVLVGDGGVVRAGDWVTVQVLRDGQPLPAFAVELRHMAGGSAESTGAWHRTDADGRVRLAVPMAGRWLLRGIDIRLSASEPDRWDTRFATLAFEAAARTAR